ncbi:MAG: hypothetical protein WBM24_19005 [Candidatus Sulfotelmatobacter sp.]
MKSRCSLWLMSLPASVALFVGQRLNAVGEMIALQLERSYPGAAGHIATTGRSRWRSPVAFLRPANWPGRRNKLGSDTVPPPAQ